MSKINNDADSIFNHPYIKALSLLGVVLPVMAFWVGHLSAYFYFSAWSLPYLKLTDASTAYSFLLESPDVSFIFLVIFVFFSIVILSIIFGRTGPSTLTTLQQERLKELRDRKQLRYIDHLKSRGIFIRVKSMIREFRNFVFFSIGFIILLLIVVSSVRLINSDYLKNDVKTKNYIPFEISFSKSNKTHQCVTVLGGLGDYLVFTNELQQTILVKKDSLNYIKPMMTTPPIEYFSRFLLWNFNLNPEFKLEQKKWLTAWDSLCGDYVNSIKYKKFKFREPPTRGQNRKPPS
jgi:hypothetical protein